MDDISEVSSLNGGLWEGGAEEEKDVLYYIRGKSLGKIDQKAKTAHVWAQPREGGKGLS